jgi:hypothetical protein
MSSSENNSDKDNLKNIDDFKKILLDLCKDLFITFPELNDNLNKDLCTILSSSQNNLDGDNEALNNVFNYCKQIFPERFFDILYQNSEMFNEDSNINTQFLPGIDFKYLWNSDISDKTRDILWKYLQLILFSIVNNMSDGNGFGDTAKLFEAINEDEFKKKLDETIHSMKDMFNDISFNQGVCGEGSEEGEGPSINLNDLPDPQQFHAHINGMMDGKLGKLAREIAEETANDLNLDPENMGDAEDYFKNLFKNPGKLMGLVKNVGDKLDSKIKSGQINERELIEEASNIVKRMKDMPGMENIQSMLSKMGIPNVGNLGGRNSKVNMGELQNQLNNNLKKAKMKERLRQKMDDKKNTNEIHITNEEREREEHILKMLNSGNNSQIETLIFSIGGEKGEKSLKSQKPNSNTNEKKKKNKNNNI